MRAARMSGWLIGLVCLGLCHCAVDDRSPRELVVSNQPGEGGAAGVGDGAVGSASGTSEPSSGSSGAVGAESGAAGSQNGAAGAESGPASGMRPGSGGTPGGAGAGPAGAAGAGATGSEGGPPPVELEGAEVPALSSSCPAFTPCGGELAGAWLYSEACPTTDLGLLQVACANGRVEYEAGTTAALSFGNGQVVRSGAPVGDSVVIFPADCSLGSCDTLAGFVGGAGQCSVENGDCACRTAFSIDWGQQSYTASGTQLRLADGRTFEYCVEGDRLSYRETGSAREPGVYTLLRN